MGDSQKYIEQEKGACKSSAPRTLKMMRKIGLGTVVHEKRQNEENYF
jgi:hypothetical protein